MNIVAVKENKRNKRSQQQEDDSNWVDEHQPTRLPEASVLSSSNLVASSNETISSLSTKDSIQPYAKAQPYAGKDPRNIPKYDKKKIASLTKKGNTIITI